MELYAKELGSLNTLFILNIYDDIPGDADIFDSPLSSYRILEILGILHNLFNIHTA